jgi:rRNA pseudouridine-1189 N-methylase Emg1 (Nep1/Mra1 family)
LPIKVPENQSNFITIIDQILEIKKHDSKGDISTLEEKIDDLVYELYGLTEEEIKIVEGN